MCLERFCRTFIRRRPAMRCMFLLCRIISSPHTCPLREIVGFASPGGTKKKQCHSERRFCAKNPSWSFVANTEGFLTVARNDDLGIFFRDPMSRRNVTIGGENGTQFSRASQCQVCFPRLRNSPQSAG